MDVELKKGSPLKSEPLQEGFHAPRENRDNPGANSLDEGSNPGADNEDTSNKTVECDEASEGQKCKVCGDNVGSLFGSIVCVPCKTFFLRYGSDHESFKCKFGGNCTITPISRTRCKHCRYQRCNAVGMWKKVRPAEIQVREGQQACVVCCDIANGVHFGAITCEGCKKFFRRGLLEHDSYSCKNDKRCPINPQTRNSCRYCRYQMCLQAGMSREAIQMGRPSKMKSEALRFLRINNNNNNNNNISSSRSQQHKKPKKRNNSSDVTIEYAMDDDDDDDINGRFTSAKKRKNCSSVGEPKENPVVLTTFQGSKRAVDDDYVSPTHVPSRNGGVGVRNQSPLSRVDGYWNDLEPMEVNNRVTKGFFLKRSPLAESRETPIENLKGQVQAIDPRMVRPSGGKNEEDFDLRHVRDQDSPWFNPRLNRQGSEHSSDFSASYKSNTKVVSYRELHTSAAVGCRDIRADKYRSRAPLDLPTFAATNGSVGYVDSGRIGEYHPRHRLNEHTHLQQRNSSGCLYQNHQQLHRNNNSLATQDILQNNNNGIFRTPLLKGPGNVANNAQFGIDSEAPSQVSNVHIPVPRDAAGISRESALHNPSLMSSSLSPVKGRRSSHPDEGNAIKRSDPRGLQRALVGKSMMKLMEEHDKVYNPKGRKQQCEGHSIVYGEPVASSSSSSSSSLSSSSSSSSLLSSSSSLITSSLLTNTHASRLLSSATLNSSSATRPSRMSFSPPLTSSASSATGSFSRQQSPVSFGGDRNSPYSSVMMLLSSCQLFNEASKNPFQLPSSAETSARGFDGTTTCNSSVADSLDEESVVDGSRNARITRLLDSPEQSRITEAYWLRHDELPDESLMLNDKHFDVINQIVIAYEKFLQCGTNINITLKKELESWNLHSQVPLQGSISLPEWIQVKVIPVYTYTSITYCKSLPGFTDLPLSDQATLIRLGQTQSRIMLAAVHWFDSKKKNFEDFLSWRPLDLFKQRLISYAEKIQKLQLDFIESALLNALIIIAADFPGLENPMLINHMRQRILLPFRAYTTAKFGTPNQRMERLFRHIPETRQLGFLHYKMTMKASLRAEEVEKNGE